MNRAAVDSGEEGPVGLLRNAMGKKGQGNAPKHRDATEPGRGGGNLLEPPESSKCGGG